MKLIVELTSLSQLENIVERILVLKGEVELYNTGVTVQMLQYITLFNYRINLVMLFNKCLVDSLDRKLVAGRSLDDLVHGREGSLTKNTTKLKVLRAHFVA